VYLNIEIRAFLSHRKSLFGDRREQLVHTGLIHNRLNIGSSVPDVPRRLLLLRCPETHKDHACVRAVSVLAPEAITRKQDNS